MPPKEPASQSSGSNGDGSAKPTAPWVATSTIGRLFSDPRSIFMASDQDLLDPNHGKRMAGSNSAPAVGGRVGAGGANNPMGIERGLKGATALTGGGDALNSGPTSDLGGNHVQQPSDRGSGERLDYSMADQGAHPGSIRGGVQSPHLSRSGSRALTDSQKRSSTAFSSDGLSSPRDGRKKPPRTRLTEGSTTLSFCNRDSGESSLSPKGNHRESIEGLTRKFNLRYPSRHKKPDGITGSPTSPSGSPTNAARYLRRSKTLPILSDSAIKRIEKSDGALQSIDTILGTLKISNTVMSIIKENIGPETENKYNVHKVKDLGTELLKYEDKFKTICNFINTKNAAIGKQDLEEDIIITTEDLMAKCFPKGSQELEELEELEQIDIKHIKNIRNIKDFIISKITINHKEGESEHITIAKPEDLLREWYNKVKESKQIEDSKKGRRGPL